jgi:hypothetical protein
MYDEPEIHLAVCAHRLLRELHSPQVAAFLDDWPATPEPRSVDPNALPVLRWLPQVRKEALPFSARFINACADAAALLAWRRSYTAAEVSAEFLDNYGWTELVGLEGPLPSEQLACGVLLLGPQVTYPAHLHEAEEIYVPLAGTAAWRRGEEDWCDRPPGTVIHHARYEPHAMRTGASALLALYVWRSKDLAQKSRILKVPP